MFTTFNTKLLTFWTQKVFIFPLRTMEVASDQVLYNIFSNVEVLINCNKEMLRELEQVMRAEAGGDVHIGDVFTKLVSLISFSVFFFTLSLN